MSTDRCDGSSVFVSLFRRSMYAWISAPFGFGLRQLRVTEARATPTLNRVALGSVALGARGAEGSVDGITIAVAVSVLVLVDADDDDDDADDDADETDMEL